MGRESERGDNGGDYSSCGFASKHTWIVEEGKSV